MYIIVYDFGTIVEFFNKYHPGPKECEDQDGSTENDMDGMFRFQKIMK